MKIAIFGAGNVGSALGHRLVHAGHHVSLAASRPDSPRLIEAASSSGADPAASLEAAGASAELVVLALPFSAVPGAVTDRVRDALVDKVVVDVTNPLAADFMSLTIGHTTSAGEQVASWLPRSHVVKAFNTIMATTLQMPVLGGVPQLLPIAGDDAAAKQAVLQLGNELGFQAIDTGPLSNARYLEPAAELLIQLGYGRGLGAEVGLHLARPLRPS